MKNKLINITILFVALFVSSCNYLEFDETSGLYTREDMYKYFNTTQQMLTNVYGYMPQDLGAVGGAMRDCGSDDAEFGRVGATVQRFNDGSWSSINTVDTSWNLYYGIRAANEFLESFANTDFTRFQYDVTYENWMKQLTHYPYEARVLRAYYFFELAKRYGDIAMPLTMLTADEANQIAKTSFEDVIEFIVSECDECAGNLPLTYAHLPSSHVGRTNRGFALAVKSKALLYAASKLHNPSEDKEKWKRAATAALELVQLSETEGGVPRFALDKSAAANNINSKEVVLFKYNSDNHSFELANFPIRFTEGQRVNIAQTTFPTQNLVDAFQTINGYDVTLVDDKWVCDDPAFNAQRPYENRDPRFARTILYNGADFKDETIEVFAGGLDDVSVVEGGSPTGYFLRKYIQEATSFTPNSSVKQKHQWVIYRLSETWLAYAESMIEAFGSATYTDQTYPISALEALNKVRENAGMPLAENTPAYSTINLETKEGFTEALRREWRVEFAFEDHRFWDIRRWMIGYETQQNIYGIHIEQAEGELTYRRDLYEVRYWNEKMNLFPIPQSELFLNAGLHPQNSGW